MDAELATFISIIPMPVLNNVFSARQDALVAIQTTQTTVLDVSRVISPLWTIPRIQ